MKKLKSHILSYPQATVRVDVLDRPKFIALRLFIVTRGEVDREKVRPWLYSLLNQYDYGKKRVVIQNGVTGDVCEVE